MPQYEFNLSDYLRIFHKRKFLILAVFIVTIIGSIIFFPEPPPIYKASTTVKIEERKTIAGLLTEWITFNPGDLMASETKIIKGFPIMKKVALRLGMLNDDSFAPEIYKEEFPEAAMPEAEVPASKEYVGEKISIDFQDADLVHIFRLLADISGYNIVVSPQVKGKFSMRLTNVPWDQVLDIILRNYGLSKTVEDNIIRIAPIAVLDREEEIIKVVSDLQDKIDTERIAQTNIIKITASSDSAKEARDLADTVAKVYLEENLLEKTKQARSAREFIEEQLSLLESRLINSEERIKEFEDKIGEITDIKKDIRLIDPIQKKLVSLKFELATLIPRYTDKHPMIIRLKEQIKDLEAQHEEEIEDLDVERKDSSGQTLEYARLSREVEVNKKLYMMFKEKLEEARITEAQKVGDVSIVDPAVMPASPVNTQKKMNMVIGGLIGLLLGIGLVFILETIDTSLGTIEDIENVVKLPVLGVIPSAKSELKKKEIKKYIREISPTTKEAEEIYIRLIVHHQPKSPLAEACRNVRTNLKLGPSKKTVLFTSAGPKEGKTTIMINLGLAVAQTGAKTLLVSSDLRRPAITKTFGINKEPGLNELISGTATLDEALKNISDIILGDTKLDKITKTPGMENIWILPSGHLSANPAEILESKKWMELIEELKKKFDIIFFDSPPVLPVTDASILASKLDSVVLCYEIGKISRDALLRTKIQLESLGVNISGVVLNQIKLQAKTLAYPYYQSYKYRYHEKDRSDNKHNAGQGQKEV